MIRDNPKVLAGHTMATLPSLTSIDQFLYMPARYALLATYPHDFLCINALQYLLKLILKILSVSRCPQSKVTYLTETLSRGEIDGYITNLIQDVPSGHG